MKKLIFLSVILLLACKKETGGKNTDVKENQTEKEVKATLVPVTYAQGFSISKQGKITVIKVNSPWDNADKTYEYALINKKDMKTIRIDASNYDAIIPTPVERFVATSTTHIPAVESLGIEDKLVGFPGTDYISSKSVRKDVENGNIQELGLNESVNTEVLIDLKPDLVMGFSIEAENKTYNTIEHAGIPVVYNGDWVEDHPLGKAEWIKFFGVFFDKEKEADSIFNEIVTSYNAAKALAQEAENRPTVLSGSMFEDIWYVPTGESWAAHFLKDAGADYLWKDTSGSGSISLNFESVLEKGQNAEFWIGPGQYTSYKQLKETNPHYTRFDAYKNKKIYTYSLSTGATGGLLYYELAPNRPDIVLKDIIHILHPEILPTYEPVFFKPLNP
ncbi:ABC transporter substrate-binding protein [Galbibacter sp. EGI 63066]|uniref:ABC transporter substrate-binding protein n=1 Tax=Galbibacter sp. EGI 63066 TaxID=2993559 RepID=UPI0022490BBC|nr:ABC transporter substrate-binding protein [Galbibacter sp. EGI 63066]MCX2678523.1 ABC transporter substrate-binding protein [Galbibacter sp. EGI 63066]